MQLQIFNSHNGKEKTKSGVLYYRSKRYILVHFMNLLKASGNQARFVLFKLNTLLVQCFFTFEYPSSCENILRIWSWHQSPGFIAKEGVPLAVDGFKPLNWILLLVEGQMWAFHLRCRQWTRNHSSTTNELFSARVLIYAAAHNLTRRFRLLKLLVALS